MVTMFSQFNIKNMKWRAPFYLFSFLLILTIVCCKKDKVEEVAFSTTHYELAVPAGFPPPMISASALTNEGVTLGRMLYSDPILSSNGMSCTSCHQQSRSFSAPFHIHPNGDTTSIPAHVNLAWKKNFLWEGTMFSIEEVCMGDFEPEFFNTNMDDLVSRLKAHPSYPDHFKKAFNIPDVGQISHQELKQKIVNAIAQYVNTLTSSNSRYDKFLNHEIMLTMDEMRGNIIFNTEEGDCFHCHGSVLFTDNRHHNNGLDEFPSGQGLGKYNFTHDSLDIGKFLAPTLRNIELTAPYMHDGRFQTLEEVVAFYNNDVHQNSPNIDPIMTKPAKQYGLHLNSYDQQCLVLFLKALTDTTFVNIPH